MSRSRSRSLTGLLLALSLGLVSIGLVATSASAAPDPLIQGVVVDGNGQPVLDVKVVAVNEDGDTMASDLSYENTDANGDPQRGYFALHVTKGTYDVVLTKKGFAKATLRGIEIKRGQWRSSQGEISLLRTTGPSGKLVKDSITVDDKGKVTVTPSGEKPTGDVEVKDGKKVVGSAVLKAKNKGEVTITLNKLAKGSHELKVVYDGSDLHQDSTSGKLTLTVKAVKKNRQVPTARAYVG